MHTSRKSDVACLEICQPSWFTPKRLLAIFCFTNFIVYLDRGLIASNGVNGSPATGDVRGRGIQGDFSLSYAQDGLLPAAFLVGLLVSSPIFAEASKHRGAFRLLGVGMAIWMLAVIGCGLSPNFLSLLSFRAFVGVGEASFVALAAPFIDDYAPAQQKTRWLAYFYLCIPTGFAAGYIFGGTVTAFFSWRVAFVLEALIMLPFVIFALTAEPVELKQSPSRDDDADDGFVGLSGDREGDREGEIGSSNAAAAAAAAAAADADALIDDEGDKLADGQRFAEAGQPTDKIPAPETERSALLSTDVPQSDSPLVPSPLVQSFRLKDLVSPSLPSSLASTPINHHHHLRHNHHLSTPAPKEPVAVELMRDVSTLLRNKLWIHLCTAYTLYVAVLGIYAYWGPKAGQQLFFKPDDDSQWVDLAFGGVTVAAGVLGSVIGGSLLDLTGSTLRRACLLCGTSVLLGAGVLELAFAFSKSFPVFLMVFGVGELLIFIMQAPVAAIGLWCVPSALRPLSVSLMTVSIHLLGDVPSSPLLGYAQAWLSRGKTVEAAAQMWRVSLSVTTALLFLSGAVFLKAVAICPDEARERDEEMGGAEVKGGRGEGLGEEGGEEEAEWGGEEGGRRGEERMATGEEGGRTTEGKNRVQIEGGNKKRTVNGRGSGGKDEELSTSLL